MLIPLVNNIQYHIFCIPTVACDQRTYVPAFPAGVAAIDDAAQCDTGEA